MLNQQLSMMNSYKVSVFSPKKSQSIELEIQVILYLFLEQHLIQNETTHI